MAAERGQTPASGAMATSQLPPPYPPCVRPLNELEPMAIADMRLETHHRGERVTLRALTPPDRMTAVMAVVEDEWGTAVLLQSYYQADEAVVPADKVMQQGDIFILKEPFFKMATDGSYSLRVDHLGDLIRLADDDQRVPSQWTKRQSTSLQRSSKDIRLQGNAAVQAMKWAEAHRLYTSAIKAAATPEDEQLAHLNRSLAHLRLGQPAKALMDAEQAENLECPTEKCLFRTARALYELQDYAKSLEILERLVALYPDSTGAKPEIQRVKIRLREQQTGAYSFRQMYKQAKATPPLIDCATFHAPVEIRSSPGRGNGLFTTIPVSAGQLLVCEKAFGYSYAGKDRPGTMSLLINLSTKKAVMGGQVNLLTQVIQKMFNDPRARDLCHELHHGSFDIPQAAEVDGNPVVDSFLVAQILSLNAFGAPRTSRDSLAQRSTGGKDNKVAQEGKFDISGIWLLASRINHSCVGNCRRSFIGDMQIIRATRDLDAGTELLFGYRAPQPLESYADVQKGLSSWGFTCGCELCLTRKSTTNEALARRKTLTKKLAGVLNGYQNTNIAAAQRILLQMEETYPPSANAPGAIRLELWDPYFAVGAALLSEGKPAVCIKMILKGLETLGFVVTATAPSAVKKAVLEVTRWGYMVDMVPWAFLQLFGAYERLAPEVCVTARSYAGTAYRIIVGEDETLTEQFPQLG
ncbi:uncharacterized protein B0I36DRAFT_273719 [Microdochium trichocladiopsis]|uniref:SET domain-containing protein n=1 Tax=Microdochium trichocladiopsis TaxID=1682393 RepID=A0A9P8Y1A2_9PEZI|nr:uncharacterized protein B0I36DRAFT_273719 [Microdochium trichocladiopsis]KAH7026646.1 hypothetical protein B0I36DRAFT_273719 [Microdochium trichocladiopsis]